MKVDLISTQDLFGLPPATWLLDRIIPHYGRVGLYGAPSSGKSFLALDWAMHISEGMPWLGRFAVKQAPVVYIAAEGGIGIQKRVREWCRHHGKSDLPAMYWLLEPLYVRNEEAVDAFLQCLETRDIFPGLVVFDTLSRSMGNGDENGPDMAHFVDRVIHIASERMMAALIVHHTNAQGSRERGHTAFRANLDAMFSCEAERNGDGRIVRVAVKNDKQKDDVESEPVYLQPAESLAGSLIFEETEAPPKKEKGNGAPKILDKAGMLAVLAQHPDGLTHKEWMLASRVPKDLFNRRRRQFVEQNEIYKDNGRYYVMAALADLVEDDENEGDE